jgi:4-hydroxy-3-polyprenylbenzoate decarboxylase
MSFTDMQSFMRVLEKRGLLKRVVVPVSAELEVTEIATRVVRDDGPAVLFENVEGAAYPLAINLLGTMDRIEIGLGRHPEEIGEGLINFLEDVNPPSASSLWRNRGSAFNLLNVRPGLALNPVVHQVVETTPDLSQMPILKCWPEDGGRFITLPLVRTRDLITGAHNMGIYRMQVYDGSTTGMHMQIQKGGAFHHVDAERASQTLDIAVALGGDPALILSAIIPLPEGIDEAGFAGVMRGKPTPMVRAKTVDVRVPAHAEFVIEGQLRPGERRLEGPFGDHFGHYSEAADFPVFRVNTITRKRRPVYPATVVGKPPQEDRALGDAAQLATKPLIRLMRKEVRDMWSYYESGFHNLLVVSVDSRYSREQMKTAFGILGEGQLSLTKVMVLVDARTDPSDIKSVARSLSRNFRVETDFRLLARTAQDTLDFTGEAFQHGSKMVLDATGYGHEADAFDGAKLSFDPKDLSSAVTRHRLICDNILVLQVRNGYSDSHGLIERAVGDPRARTLKAVVLVSEDVDIEDDVELIWGVFTRFDCALDVVFTAQRFMGITPVYSGVMGIDATWKPGYQKPLEMDPEIVRLVDRRWNEYWE